MPPQTRARAAPSALTLPSDLEVRIERAFDAPAKKVWRAWTDPELLPRWLGPARHKMTTSEVDPRPGGKYRWAWDVDGQELVIHGAFLDADPPHRMVTREVMEPFPGYTLNLIVLTESKGRTTCALHITFATKEARDGALASGMQGGIDEGYARLDALLGAL